MKYINKRTKVIIDVESKIKGDNWEVVDEEKKASSAAPPKKTGTRKKASEK